MKGSVVQADPAPVYKAEYATPLNVGELERPCDECLCESVGLELFGSAAGTFFSKSKFEFSR